MDKFKKILEIIANCSEPEQIQELKDLICLQDPALYEEFCKLLCEKGPDGATISEIAREIRADRDAADQNTEPFFAKMFEYMKKKGLTDPDVYKHVGMHRNNWNRFIKTQGTTSHENYLKICVALKLDYYQAVSLLALARVGFSQDITDRVIAKCLNAKIYDTYKIDELLYDLGGATLYRDKE